MTRSDLEFLAEHYPGPGVQLGDEDREIVTSDLVRAGLLEVLRPDRLN